jgi:hypothetical protein
VAAVRFEEQRDRWMDRCGRGDVLADELLLSLAPREYRGVVDWYWLAAAHVALAGVAVSQELALIRYGRARQCNPHPNPDQIES